MTTLLQNKNKYEDHIKWITELNTEYNQLLKEQTAEYSPCSRTRNIKRIWNEERKRPPRVNRQKAVNKSTIIIVNL